MKSVTGLRSPRRNRRLSFAWRHVYDTSRNGWVRLRTSKSWLVLSPKHTQ